jgi:hypothetical protein
MAGTVAVNCAYCGKQIGEIMRVPGENHLGCPYCQGVTNAVIGRDGTSKMLPYTPPPSKPEPVEQKSRSSPTSNSNQERTGLLYHYLNTELGNPRLPEYDLFSKSWHTPPRAMKSVLYYLFLSSDHLVEHGIDATIEGGYGSGKQILKSGSFRMGKEQIFITWSDGNRSTIEFNEEGVLMFEGHPYTQ